MDPYLGEIRPVGFNFAPQGWAFCAGQILSIAQNTALFSLLGTNYGGNGTTTFALPDLRGRVPVGTGQGPGLSTYDLGESSGTETHTLILSEIPPHKHSLQVDTNNAAFETPAGHYPAVSARKVYGTGTPTSTLPLTGVGIGGGDLPHNNMQPYLTVNYIIALQGIYPTRP
jgi:microcystin-dependent protein